MTDGLAPLVEPVIRLSGPGHTLTTAVSHGNHLPSSSSFDPTPCSPDWPLNQQQKTIHSGYLSRRKNVDLWITTLTLLEHRFPTPVELVRCADDPRPPKAATASDDWRYVESALRNFRCPRQPTSRPAQQTDHHCPRHRPKSRTIGLDCTNLQHPYTDLSTPLSAPAQALALAPARAFASRAADDQAHELDVPPVEGADHADITACTISRRYASRQWNRVRDTDRLPPSHGVSTFHGVVTSSLIPPSTGC